MDFDETPTHLGGIVSIPGEENDRAIKSYADAKIVFQGHPRALSRWVESTLNAGDVILTIPDRDWFWDMAYTKQSVVWEGTHTCIEGMGVYQLRDGYVGALVLYDGDKLLQRIGEVKFSEQDVDLVDYVHNRFSVLLNWDYDTKGTAIPGFWFKD